MPICGPAEESLVHTKLVCGVCTWQDDGLTYQVLWKNVVGRFCFAGHLAAHANPGIGFFLLL